MPRSCRAAQPRGPAAAGHFEGPLVRLPGIPGSSGPDPHLTAPLCPPAGLELGRGGRAAFPPGGAPGAAPRSPARPAWRPKTRGPIKQRPTRHRAAGAPQGTAPVDARRPPWSACASGRRLEGTPVFDTTLHDAQRAKEAQLQVRAWQAVQVRMLRAPGAAAARPAARKGVPLDSDRAAATPPPAAGLQSCPSPPTLPAAPHGRGTHVQARESVHYDHSYTTGSARRRMLAPGNRAPALVAVVAAAAVAAVALMGGGGGRRRPRPVQ